MWSFQYSSPLKLSLLSIVLWLLCLVAILLSVVLVITIWLPSAAVVGAPRKWHRGLWKIHQIIFSVIITTKSSSLSLVWLLFYITKSSPQEMTPWAVKDPPNHIFCNHYQKVFIVVISVITILYYQEHSPGNDTVGCERLLAP